MSERMLNAAHAVTGEVLHYLVPESHFDHPVLGRGIRRLPSQKPDVDPTVEVMLKGADLEKALKDRGLTTDGRADEKRARIAQHDAALDPVDTVDPDTSTAPAADPVNTTDTPATGDHEGN